MKEIILFEIGHIKLIKTENAKLCLIIKDAELNDFVEDYLWDNYEIDIDSTEEVIDENILIEALKKIDFVEVERIYKLNN